MGQEIIISTVEQALAESIKAPKLDPIILSVANMFIEGKNITVIAEEFDVPADIITNTLDKKEVKTYIETVYQSTGFMNRFKRLGLMNIVIEEKLKEAIEVGFHSKKDLLEWMKLMEVMDSNARPKKEGPAVAIQVNNNYDKLVNDLLEDRK